MNSIQQSSTPFDPHESAAGNQTCKIFVEVPSTKKESEYLLVFFCLEPLKYLPSQCLSDQEQFFSFSASEIPELVPQSCPTLSDRMDCSPPGSSVHEFSRQEYWSGLPLPSPWDLPEPGIKPGFPALQADCLLSEPPGEPPETTNTHIIPPIEKICQ